MRLTEDQKRAREAKIAVYRAAIDENFNGMVAPFGRFAGLRTPSELGALQQYVLHGRRLLKPEMIDKLDAAVVRLRSTAAPATIKPDQNRGDVAATLPATEATTAHTLTFALPAGCTGIRLQITFVSKEN